MARIAGINVPDNKHICISLTYIFGIGRSTANDICKTTKINPQKLVAKLTENELEKVRNAVAKYSTEGDKRREVTLNIKRLMDLGCYRGIRHRKNLPVRGQNTKNNARTRKGPRKMPVKK